MAKTLGFEWLVALRFLREGRMQTLLIIVGVAAGVRGGGAARPLGLAAGGFLAELCCGGSLICYQPNSC